MKEHRTTGGTLDAIKRRLEGASRIADREESQLRLLVARCRTKDERWDARSLPTNFAWDKKHARVWMPLQRVLLAIRLRLQ